MNIKKISFLTFPKGHLVSDREFERIKKAFAKRHIEVVREYEDDCDLILVKGFSHTWDDVRTWLKPIVCYSIGVNYKVGDDLIASNEPFKELYLKSDAVIHISKYCQDNVEKVFGKRNNVYQIIPACEPYLPKKYPSATEGIKCVSTAIWRTIKRQGELLRMFELLKKDGVNATLDLYGPGGGPELNDLDIYHNYHIYVQLSRSEGMPNTVLEALSHGLPCLITNCGGGKEAVGNAGVVIQNDPSDDVLFDLGNIEPINYELFKKGFLEIVNNLESYQQKVRERLEVLNDDKFVIEFLNSIKNLWQK